MGSGKGSTKRTNVVAMLKKPVYTERDQDIFLYDAGENLNTEKLCEVFNLPKGLLAAKFYGDNDMTIDYKLFAKLMAKDVNGLNKWNNMTKKVWDKYEFKASFQLNASKNEKRNVINISSKQEQTNVSGQKQLHLYNTFINDAKIITNGADVVLFHSDFHDVDCEDASWFRALKSSTFRNCNIKAHGIDIDNCSGYDNDFSQCESKTTVNDLFKFDNNNFNKIRIHDVDSSHLVIRANEIDDLVLENTDLEVVTSSGNSFDKCTMRNINIDKLCLSYPEDIITRSFKEEDITTNSVDRLIDDETHEDIILEHDSAYADFDILKTLNVVSIKPDPLPEKPINENVNF